MKILIADDDPQILRALHVILRARGYQALGAANGADALNLAIEHRPDLYVIDLGMPGLTGLELIAGIRGWSRAPILVVSGRTDAVDKVQALDAGADDYLTKPFDIDELLARLRALGRRHGSVETQAVLRMGTVVVDLSSKRVLDEHGAEIRMTPTEWKVLEILARNEGKLVTRQMLLTEIWGSEHVADTGYLRLYISQLRRKIEADPANPVHLLTSPGMGYRLEIN